MGSDKCTIGHLQPLKVTQEHNILATVVTNCKINLQKWPKLFNFAKCVHADGDITFIWRWSHQINIHELGNLNLRQSAANFIKKNP